MFMQLNYDSSELNVLLFPFTKSTAFCILKMTESECDMNFLTLQYSERQSACHQFAANFIFIARQYQLHLEMDITSSITDTPHHLTSSTSTPKNTQHK